MEYTQDIFDIKAFLKSLSAKPGVYRMIGEANEVLYVGKARNLKARVSSYFSKTLSSTKIQSLVRQIKYIEVTITQSEAEALLLESNLIKEYRPRYNVTLRDDKSYPYIYVSTSHTFPRLGFHRGARNQQGSYYGPYPSAYAVRDTLRLLQKLFRVRQCEDGFFKNRSRPCLEYQIGRCTAPCVGYISESEYREDIEHAILFLEGKTESVITHLISRMDKASEQFDYERAAHYRDQIRDLHKIQERQFIAGMEGNIDIIACAHEAGEYCIQVFYIRGGRNLGNKTFFPKSLQDSGIGEILSAFISQYYLNREIPDAIWVHDDFEDRELLLRALTQKSGRSIKIPVCRYGEKARWLKMALTNAEQSIKLKQASQLNVLQKLKNLQDILELKSRPERMECFDISHTAGEATVAACVVFDSNGPLKSDYRRFNIKDIKLSDDYAAMRQALERRYSRLKREDAKLPDILFIDGGKGQVNEAIQVLNTLQIEGVNIVGIAKGPERIAGNETLIAPHLNKTLQLSADLPGFHLIQHIRDEAHRFAISGHRAQRSKKRTTSPLEAIPGLGQKRRRQLLKYFGGMQGVCNATPEELAKVPNISERLAQIVYDKLHS